MNLTKLRKEIFEKAHLVESANLARKYFKDIGLQLDDFYPKSTYYKLSEFIQDEIYILLADKSYSMIGKLRMSSNMKFNKDGINLLTDGFYFEKREAITFNFRTNFIGFCGWASGCNKIPYIKGFIKWCDYMKNITHDTQ